MEDTKEKILLAALRLFANDGYEAVSVSEIAGELGITKGALYKHYKNKKDIFDSIVKRMEEMDFTRKFSLGDQRDLEIKNILSAVYQALQEKGYNPINQIVGYILSEDPTYITNHNNARALIRKVDRDELLQTLVKYYLTH